VGLGSYLQTLAAAITGQGQPAPQSQQISNLASAGFPGAQQMQQNAPAPQSGGGLTGFLGSPLTQAALQGYFSAAGSPRLAGLGGRISAGGLGALGGFNAAEANQAKQQQAQAALQGSQAKNQLTAAQAALAQGKAGQIAGVGEANAHLAAQIEAAKPTMTPTQQQRATIVANTIAADTSTPHTLSEAFTQIYQEPLKESQIQAQTAASTAAGQKSQAETAAIPSEEALRSAETNRANVEAATVPEKMALDTEKTEKPAGTTKPRDPLLNLNSLRTLYDKSYGGASGALASGWSEVTGGAGRPSFEQFAVSKGFDPSSGEKLPALPAAGWNYSLDPSGQVIATDPSGTPHKWVPDS
jgi:hypothetical protein